ncbi:hypothetical protein CKF54_07970, partial [Psittacicella hinzii]
NCGIQVLELYRGKELLEQAGKDLIALEDSYRLSQDPQAVKGKAFVMFISLILRSALRNKVKGTRIEHKYSLQEIIEELDDIKFLITKDSKVIHPMSEEQREILAELKIKLDD